MISNFIRGIVKKNPQLKLKLKKAGSKQTPFQYVYQSLFMTGFSIAALGFVIYMVFNNNLFNLFLGFGFLILFSPVLYRFWFGFVDVQIRKYGRELDGDILFVSEFFLVSLESGLPLGNAIQRLSELKRPGGRFFKKIYIEFKTGKDLEKAIEDASEYSPSESMKILLKRLKDSLSIGVDLRVVLKNFILESSEKKIVEIKAFSKKLNPVIMMYLLIGIVLPSLGITFFILAAALLDITPEFLKWLLALIFIVMFLFQYLSYSSFKFGKSTL